MSGPEYSREIKIFRGWSQASLLLAHATSGWSQASLLLAHATSGWSQASLLLAHATLGERKLRAPNIVGK